MKVYFIGAGPGAVDLITVRGARILAEAEMVLYAGSLVNSEMLDYCRKGARTINTAQLNLDEQQRLYLEAHANNWDVARLHSGDPAIYGATAEQTRRLDKLGIAYEIIPGVSSFLSAAAVMNFELTKPGITQTVILTRTTGRASPVPEDEALSLLASHKATLCIFLSGGNLARVVSELRCSYSPNTPVALIHKVSWPQEKIYRGTLERVLHEINPAEWVLSTLFIIGEVLDSAKGEDSRLYHSAYSHRFRKGTPRE
ncbi:MAG: precorrin-4 C(11)-methyltransferase [Verrucomicrobia bacterium]|nr:precorrin-4 C(11)-methyltransferase [Verrucomicrobiota bacterium]